MKKISRCVTAIREGDAHTVNLLLDDGVNPSADLYSWTLLIHAVRECNSSLVRLLLERGADWRGKDGFGRQALSVACLKGSSLNVISILLEFGACFPHPAFRAACFGDLEFLDNYTNPKDRAMLLNLRDETGYNILHYAAVQGQKDFIIKLNPTKAEMEVESENELRESVLLLVAYCGTPDFIDYLVDTYDLNPMAARGSKDGTTALLYASYSGNTQVVEHYVSKYKCDVVNHRDDYGQTCVLNAAYTGRIELLDLLVSKYKVDIMSERNKGGKSALLLAILDNQVHMVKHLINKYKFDARVDRDTNGYSAVLLCAWYGHEVLLDYFVGECGCDIHKDRDVGSRSALCNAIRNDKLEIVQHLIDVHGVEFENDRDGEGANAILLAARAGSIPILEYFLKRNTLRCDNPASSSSEESERSERSSVIFDVRNDRDRDGYSCILIAIWYGKIPMIDHLLNKYNVNLVGERDKNGHGPLILAVLGKQIQSLTHLIEVHHVDVNERDTSENTPLLVAAARGNIEIIDLLIGKYHCDPRSEANRMHLTALAYAVMFQHKQTIDHLIYKYGCDPLSPFEETDSHENIMHLTTDEDDPAIFEHILSTHKCHELLSRRTKDGESPFLRSVRYGRIKMMSHLINNYNASVDLDVDFQGNCALLVAAKYAQREIFDELVKVYKVDIFALNNAGENAVVVAHTRSQFRTEDYIKTYYFMISYPRFLDDHIWQQWLLDKPASDDIEPCMICYERTEFSTSLGHLPCLKCPTCKQCYHSYCFYSWIKKCNVQLARCALCQQYIPS